MLFNLSLLFYITKTNIRVTSARLAEIKRQLKRTEGWDHFKYIVDKINKMCKIFFIC